MINQLLDMYNKGIYFSIYTNHEESDKFNFGRLLYVDDNYSVIYRISPKGKYDGILVVQTDDIFRIESKSQYSSRMEKLCGGFNFKIDDIEFDNEDILSSVLSYAANTRRIITCELLKSGCDDVIGFVESVKDGELKLNQINQYGYDDGYSYVKVEDITRISYDSEDEQDLLKLWTANYQD